MPQPIKIFERRADQHAAGCARAVLGVAATGVLVAGADLLVILFLLRGSGWPAVAGTVAAGGILWALLAGWVLARPFLRSRERVAFYEDRVDVNWKVTRLSEIESVRPAGRRVRMRDTSGRETTLPDVADADELLAWFKTRLPPDRLL